MTPTIIDLYAGPGLGGWDVGARDLGLHPVGYETDEAACATRVAAGHLTIRQDVATAWVPPHDGLIASPPCQAFSMAGDRKGIDDLPRIYAWIAACADGWAEDPTGPEPWADDRSKHVMQPLRWAWHGKPEWVVCEQVPPCLPVWEAMLTVLRRWGYHGWCAVLNAADYGVPQTRRRAILCASRVAVPAVPEVTHVDPRKGDSLFHRPWVSMADALGWTGDLFTGHAMNSIEWVLTRPATSVCGDPRITDPNTVTARRNGDLNPDTGQPWRQTDNAIKVELRELAVLQGFDRDYPFRGTKTKRAEQIGNAVPPGLARAVLSTVMTAQKAAA